MQFVLLSSILLIGAVDGRRLTDNYLACPKNELYAKCGTINEPSCENPEPVKSKFDCVAGCQCEKGFVRRADKKCVHKYQCDIPTPPPLTTCPENEYLIDCQNECYDDRECPILTADGFVFKNQSLSDCFSRCTIRCACKEGLYRNHEGRCVKEAECPPPGHECKGNETFRFIGLIYEPSCRTPYVIVPPLSFFMFKTDCFCNTGFLRNAEGECVKEADYPYEDPEDKCKLAECPNSDICIMHKGKPVCVPQLLMSLHLMRGVLITKSQDGQCKLNEKFTTCKKSCSETKCNEEPKTCPDVCNGSGCVCQEGFFRDRFGFCMTESDCSDQKKNLDPFLDDYFARA